MNSESGSNTTVDAVKHSFEIVRKLQELDGAGVTELASHLEMTKGGIHKHLQTLVEVGFVTQEDSEYRLSFEFLSVSQRITTDNIVYNIGAPEIDTLATKTTFGAYLVLLEDVHAYCLYTAEGENSVGTAIEVGDKIPFHSTSAGKAILSKVSDKKRERLLQEPLEKKTSETSTNIDNLEAEISRIQDEGVAFEDEENVYGMRGVAVPLDQPSNGSIGAVGTIGPVSLIDDEQFKEDLPDLVMQTTNFVEVKSSLTPPTRLR